MIHILLLAFCVLFLIFMSFILTPSRSEPSKAEKIKNRDPEYFVICHEGNWFPVKKSPRGHSFIKTIYDESPHWDFEKPICFHIPFKYPNLYAYEKGEAINLIEKLEGVEIVEIEGSRIFKDSGKHLYFERKNRDLGDVEDFESLEEYMDAQFGIRKNVDVNLGAERIETNSGRNYNSRKEQAKRKANKYNFNINDLKKVHD